MRLSAKINGLELNAPSNGITVDGEIVGLGLPDIRTSSGVYSGKHGGYVGPQFYGVRNIAIPGQIIGDDEADYEARRIELSDALALGSDLPLEITTPGGREYLVNCKLVKLEIPFVNNPVTTKYTLELVAPDPVIYDNSAGGLNSVTIEPARGGGIRWPVTWPITWVGGTQPTTVNNAGSVTMFPVFTLTGSMTNPIIENLTTGQFVSLSGLTTGTDSEVIIDMSAPSVLLDGGSALPYVTTASSWIGLVPGDNTLKLTTSSGSDTVTGVVTWRSGFMAA